MHLQEFLNKYSESKFEFADSTINFGRHRIVECAREILEKSQNGALTKDYFIQISDDLEMLLLDVRYLDTHTHTHTHTYLVYCPGIQIYVHIYIANSKRDKQNKFAISNQGRLWL